MFWSHHEKVVLLYPDVFTLLINGLRSLLLITIELVSVVSTSVSVVGILTLTLLLYVFVFLRNK